MVLHSGFNWIPDHISKKTPCGTGYCRENWIFIFVFVRWEEFIYKASSGLCLIELTGLKHLTWPEQRKGVGIEDPGFTTLVLFFWNLSFGLPAVDLPGFFHCSKVIPWTSFRKSHIASPIWHILDHLLPNWQFVHWESTQEHILQLVSLQAEHSITFAGSLV